MCFKGWEWVVRSKTSSPSSPLGMPLTVCIVNSFTEYIHVCHGIEYRLWLHIVISIVISNSMLTKNVNFDQQSKRVPLNEITQSRRAARGRGEGPREQYPLNPAYQWVPRGSLKMALRGSPRGDQHSFSWIPGNLWTAPAIPHVYLEMACIGSSTQYLHSGSYDQVLVCCKIKVSG